MLALDSTRWSDLQSAGGNPLLVPRLIQRLATNPTEQDWAEIWEQVSHQWSLYSSAYAALPHLLRLGIKQGISTQPDFLLCLGRVAAPLECTEQCPEDLKPPFEAALREAAAIALEAAQNSAAEPRDYVCVLQAAAALNGRRVPGTQLFFSLGSKSPEVELNCPECDEYLLGELGAEGLYLQSVDIHAKPRSKKVKVIPREPPTGSWTGEDLPPEDFDWLAVLCQRAKQDQVLFWICCLYGKGRCPMCLAEFTVMSEVESSHDV